jgi:hypothetical protein
MILVGRVAAASILAMTHLRGAALPCDSCAVIVNSGSTNAAGFRILVDRSGNAEYTVTSRRARPQGDQAAAKPVRRKVPEALVRRLYSDLEGAQPPSSLPHHRCFKSVSFGTKVTIEAGKEITPDLSCTEEQDAHIQVLMRDVNEIAKYFRNPEPQ